MVTENVNIVFRETGARVIKRKIDEIGEAANQATRGIFLMQRALFVLGGAGAIRGISRQLDLLTNMENRLNLTAKSAANLEAVQSRLFDVARASRSSFESVAEVYNRTALSVRELGISQQETLRFTESLSKATIISGASAREAQAALIQLGQGMASNTLRGDELRSVLEQLPYVADVIAKELGVTRGELREMGTDGKISAETVLRAFRNAQGEIDRLFANTVPTIGQAFEVATTNFLQFLDQVDDATGITGKLAQAIITLSENLDLLIISIGTVGGLFAASFAASKVQLLLQFAAGLRANAVAGARLVEIENLRAASAVRRAQNELGLNQARQMELAQRLRLIAVQKAQLQQDILEAEYSVVNGRARNLQTGQFVNLATAKANLTRLTTQLNIVEGVEAAQAQRLAVQRGLQAGATNTAAAAEARLAAAEAASGSFTARLQRNFPLLAGSISAVTKGLRVLFALITANPIAKLVTTLVVAVGWFVAFGDEVTAVQGKLANLHDVVGAAFELIGEAIGPALSSATTAISNFASDAVDYFSDLASDIGAFAVDAAIRFIDGITFIPRGVIGVVAGIVAIWDTLPALAAGVATGIANAFISGFEALANGAIKALNKLIEGLNTLLSFVGADKAAELCGFSGQIGTIGEVAIDRFVAKSGTAGQDAGDAFAKGFKTAFEGGKIQSVVDTATNALAPIGNRVLARAERNAQNRAADNALIAKARAAELAKTTNPTTKTPGGSGGGGGKQSKDFASIIAGMNQEIELLGKSKMERERLQEVLKIEKELKRSLTEEERNLALATLQNLEIAKSAADIMDSIQAPRQQAIIDIQALNMLYQNGTIALQDYIVKLRELKIAADEASGTLAGGFSASIAKSIMSAAELGSALGDYVVGAADDAASAIVDFAKTGELNIRQVFQTLFANIAKLAAQQLILSFLGPLLGIPTGGATGGGGALGLLGLASGGSILPSGPGSTDSQVVSFKKRPDERVDVLTPQQQRAQKQNMQGQAPVVAPAPNVNVAAVLSDKDIVGAFDNDDGETVVFKMLERNASRVRAIAGTS